MGKASDAMQTVVDEIRSSRKAREGSLRELSERTRRLLEEGKNLVNDVRSEREDRARQLREELDKTRKRLAAEKKRVAQDTHNLLLRFRREQEDTAKELKRRLAEQKDIRLSSVREFKESVEKMLDEIKSDIERAHRIWMEEVRKKTAEEVEREIKEEKTEEEKNSEEEKEQETTDEEKILRIVSEHPDGIRLVDIGNELGVDWRTLIPAVRSLVDTGKVEKINNTYYPGKEG